MLRVYFFICAVVLVKAQIPSLGFCPDYLPMADFDIDSFLGKWYETERYFQFTEVTSRCVVTDYAKGTSGKIYVSNEVTSRLTGIKRVIDGQLELTGRVGEGKFNIKYSTTPISSQATLTVLETDYDNYAVLWSCSGFGPVHTQSVWAMTRERLPSGPVLQKIYGVLDKFKISRNFFVKTDQEGCALAASDINAANGINLVSTVAEATGSPQRKTQVTKKKVVNKNQTVKNTNDLEAVKSVDDNLEEPQSVADSFEAQEIVPAVVIPAVVVPEEVVPQRDFSESNEDSIVPEVIIPESDYSGVIKTVPFLSNPIKVDALETSAVSSAIQDADIKSEDSKSIPENELKPLHMAEIILQNNPVEPFELNNNVLKAQIVPVMEPVGLITENVPVAEVIEILEERLTPVKGGIDDKN